MKKRILTLLCCVFAAVFAVAQNVDFRTMEPSKMADSQIRRITTEMSAKGYSIEQLKSLAKAKGASDRQISDLVKRINEVSKSKTTSSSVSNSKNIVEKEKSGRAEFVASHADSLVFGFQLFNNSKLTFEPNINVPVSDDYVLGVGDELVVDIWGQSRMTYDLTVSSNGCIDIPIAGPVYVMGASFRNAKSIVESKLKTIYSDLGNGTSASVKIGNLRTINVHVIGEVFAPGTYTVSGAASLFNVLYLSGGPNANGSFRNIQLIRGGKIVSTLDVYDYLLNGNTLSNVGLCSEDIVMVPTYQKRVEVIGEFKRTGYFEAIEGETVDNIIKYAGGFATHALASHVSLVRIGEHGKEFKDVASGSRLAIMNGDAISVAKVDDSRTDNVVTITGGVFAPGSYEWHEGLKLGDLLKNAGGLVENAFLNRGVITRMKEDRTLQSINFNVADLASGAYDVTLADNDAVIISTIDDMRERPIVTVKGAVRSPMSFEYREGMTVGDLIFLAGGLTESASPNSVEIIRKLTDESADTSVYKVSEETTIRISKELSLGDEQNSFELKPFDIVTIRSTMSSRFRGTIRITGEVKMEGTYEMVTKNDNIMTMINRAGGLTANAYVDGAKLFRRRIYNEKERDIKIAQALAQSEDSAKAMAMFDENMYELVSIDLAAIISNKTRVENLRLQDGDEIVIPSKLQTVRVGGEVLNPLSVMYTKRMNAKRYVDLAGGFSNKALKKRTYVVYPDGHAAATRHFLWFRIYPKVDPGCEVVVPVKPERQGLNAIQITSISSSVVTMAAVVVSVLSNL